MAPWHVHILTLFPEMFPGPLAFSLSGKALEKNLWSYNTINIRDFAEGVHKRVDDTPFGGGAGMVLQAEPIERALLSIDNPGRKIYLSARGRPFTQQYAESLIHDQSLTLLCGRYEGVDQRVLEAHAFEEISIGDYILSGGELPAQILMDACIRLIPGVMGNEETVSEESFSGAGLLEYPHYTRPAQWRASDGKTYSVPDVFSFRTP